MKHNPFEAMPEAVDIHGISVPVDSDFRVCIALESELLNGTPDVVGLLMLFYKGKIPKDVGTAVERMLWFYSHHDGQEESKKSGGGTKGRWYDFEQDADALLASFLSAYNLDLSTARLHWWTFRRLMLNLPAETPFMQRVRYRTADLKKLGKEERKHYKKMRALYAIKSHGPVMTVEEREAAFRERVQKRMQQNKEI